MTVRRYTLETTDRPDVLVRVLSLCHQRRCEVRSLSYAAGDHHRGTELVLTVRAPGRHAERLSVWLEGLVDVVAVRDSSVR